MDSFLYVVGIIACILICAGLSGGALYVVLQAIRVPWLMENKADKSGVSHLWDILDEHRRQDRDGRAALDKRLTDLGRLFDKVVNRLDGFDERADLAFEGLKMQREGAEALASQVAALDERFGPLNTLTGLHGGRIAALTQRVENLEPKDCSTDAPDGPSRTRTLR